MMGTPDTAVPVQYWSALPDPGGHQSVAEGETDGRIAGIPGMIRSTTRCTAVLLIVSVALSLSGCGLWAHQGGVRSSQTGSLACTSRVTPDCSAYQYANPRPGTVVVTAPRSSAVNNREFFWSPSSPVGVDLTVCATFVSGQGLDQQGVVLRLHELSALSLIHI